MFDAAQSNVLNEKRFQPPPGWREGSFERNGYRLRYGMAWPESGTPDAIVVGLGGVNEFCEKYFEVAHDELNRNRAFWMMDWRGQGRSDRYLPDRTKRHGGDFSNDVEDLHAFIKDYVLPAAVSTDKGRIPLVMLAHSMGGNIGLRYLQRYGDTFACAALSAPLCGVLLPYGLRHAPFWFQKGLTSAFSLALDKGATPELTGDPLSSDPLRSKVMDAWYDANPELRCGRVTWTWLRHAVGSCAIVNGGKFLKNVKTPVLMALAGQDRLVDNDCALKVAEKLPDCTVLQMDGARHEIMMEQDVFRDRFFNAFDEFVSSRLPTQLKPF